MNRSDHLKWCKNRALEYVAEGDDEQAVASMVSDLGKHEETISDLSFASSLGLLAIKSGTASVREFINGFN